jgi:carbon-monoxide dehydrogenase medium subunit
MERTESHLMTRTDTEYIFPDSIKESVQRLAAAGGEARIIAGGTDVLPDIRRAKIRPRYLLDITRIPELNEIRVGAEFVEIGAAVSFAAIKDSVYLNRHVHALADAARSVGALAIQNAATWVGNLVQGMPAADGAIISLALEAEVCVVDSKGAEWRPVEALFLGPGVSAIDPTRQLVTQVRFPRLGVGVGTAWHRIGRRPSLVLPILNCAVKLTLDLSRERVAHVTIALGPVAPHPFRAHKAEEFLRGQATTSGSFDQAARLVQQEAHPRDSITRASRAYRLSVIPPLIADALGTAAQRARSIL